MENRKFMIDGETFSNNEFSALGHPHRYNDDNREDGDDDHDDDDELYQRGDSLNNFDDPDESYQTKQQNKSTGLVTKRVKVIKKVTRKINIEDEIDFNNYNEDNIEVNEEPEAMPQEYYHDVDSFLSKPAPKIKLSKKNSKPSFSEKQMRPSVNNDEINYGLRKGEGILPRIGSGDNQPPKPPVSNKLGPTGIRSKVSSIRSNKPVITKSKPIDTDLLMQAFSYTEQIVREEMMEEQQAMIADNNTHGQVSSAPNNSRRPIYGENNPLIQQPRSAPTGSKKQVTGKKCKGNGLVKKLRGGITADNAGFGVATIHESDSRRNVIDFDSLVANFEQGLNLQKLQDELKQSKASIAKSENFMRELAREYSSGK